MIQYAPGTQLSCGGLLGLVDCLLNDVLKLGGTILGDLPLVNGLVASWTITGFWRYPINRMSFTSAKTGR